MAQKITQQTKNTIIMAHDLNVVLTMLAQKIQMGQEITKEDLQSVPTIASYSSQVLKNLLEAMTEEPDAVGESAEEAPLEGQVQ